MHGMTERKAEEYVIVIARWHENVFFFFFFRVTDRRVRDAMLIIAKTGEISRHVKLIMPCGRRASPRCLKIFAPLFFLFLFFFVFYYFISFNGDDKVIVRYVVDLLSIAVISSFHLTLEYITLLIGNKVIKYMYI